MATKFYLGVLSFLKFGGSLIRNDLLGYPAAVSRSGITRPRRTAQFWAVFFFDRCTRYATTAREDFPFTLPFLYPLPSQTAATSPCEPGQANTEQLRDRLISRAITVEVNLHQAGSFRDPPNGWQPPLA